ncbi:MAG: DNA-3-methyladenine glycosylase I [candidate division WOR-3 bacterium]|nr:MAG: DNA-3-methyladenine glycosylase I [candidate division WOR-3 bacterium]
MNEKRLKRCAWAEGSSVKMLRYHDKEWGVPVHNDRRLFEFLILEGAQAGLSWNTILERRKGYRKAFGNFDARKISGFTRRDVARLLKDEGIIRNRLKIEATIENAKRLLEVKKEFGSFDRYIWQFVGGTAIRNRIRKISQLPAETEISRIMSRDMKKRGFRFVGPTICYAFMQAVGMVNDHTTGCFRYREIDRL